MSCYQLAATVVWGMTEDEIAEMKLKISLLEAMTRRVGSAADERRIMLIHEDLRHLPMVL